MRLNADELFPRSQCGGVAGVGNSNGNGNCSPGNPAHQNARIELSAIVAYPGSRVSDVLIGGHKVQVPNEALRRAMEESQ